MGVLYARVDGAWVPVIASPPPPADEVWVGPNAPTASETELWVDSDLTPAPMLFAKIGGNWTQVSAPPTNEVAVQAAQPTGSEELWYDTDAPGYTTDDLRWQSAWGIVAMGSATSGTIAANTITNVGSISASIVAGRRYKLTGKARAITSTPASGGWLRWVGQDVTMNDTWGWIGGNYQNLSAELIFTASTTGAYSWTLQANSNVSWYLYFDYQCSFVTLEDMGPAVPSVPAAVNTAAYGKLNSVTGGTVGSTKNPVTWNAPTGAGFAGRNMTATANGLVVQTAGRYQVNFAASLANCSGGAYMVPQLQVVRAGSSVDSVSVVVGPSGYWLDAHINGQLNAQAGDELRARLDTDIAGCSFDNRTWLEATLIGPL